MLPGLWARIVDDKVLRRLVFDCVKGNDFPEVQEYGEDGNPIKGPHSEGTKAGIRMFVQLA